MVCISIFQAYKFAIEMKKELQFFLSQYFRSDIQGTGKRWLFNIILKVDVTYNFDIYIHLSILDFTHLVYEFYF